MADVSAIQLSHMLATLRSVDVIANNLANSSTPGFKREAVKFEEVLKRETPEEGETTPQITSFVREAGVLQDLRQGQLVTTSAPFDLAIAGEGFFPIQTSSGLRYTRNGHFGLDAQGQLVTSEGNALQGESGSVVVTADDGEVHVAPDGVVSGRKGTIAKLRLVQFADPQSLRKEGASLYSTTESPVPATGRIVQGSIEGSNVEPVMEIARMIDVMRAYETTANLIQAKEREEGNTLEKLAKMP